MKSISRNFSWNQFDILQLLASKVSTSDGAEMKEDDSKADPKAAEDPAKKEYRTEKRKKVISKTIDLPVTSIVVGAMSRDKLEAAVEQEKVLVNQDTYEGNRYVL